MNEQEYIEGLAKELCRQGLEILGMVYDEDYIRENYHNWVPQAQAVADWHREQGLQVIPADHVSMPRGVFNMLWAKGDGGHE